MRKTDSIWILKSNLKENDVEDTNSAAVRSECIPSRSRQPKTHTPHPFVQQLLPEVTVPTDVSVKKGCLSKCINKEKI